MSPEDVQKEKEGKYQPLSPSPFSRCGWLWEDTDLPIPLFKQAYASPPSPQVPRSEGIPLVGLKNKSAWYNLNLIFFGQFSWKKIIIIWECPAEVNH